MKSAEFEKYCRQLFVKSQKGDKKAYHELLVAIAQYIKLSVRKHFSNEQVAEDLVQEILIAFHRSKHTYDTCKPFKPWLAAIVRFKTIDQLRKIYRHREREVHIDNYETNEQLAANMDFDTYLDLEKALGQLPDKQRKAFSLLKLNGLSVKEAADETGWSESNIKVSAHRAYKLLRKVLGEKGI